MSGAPALRKAVILTAIRVESDAVLEHLPGAHEEPVDGTMFSVGRFEGWDVAVAETSAGNSGAAAITQRAIAHYQAEVALFVGVAGGVKDVVVGDVVVGQVVYAYDKGKETEGRFRERSDPYRSSYDLEQIAQCRDVEGECGAVLGGRTIVPGVVLAGDKVIAATKGEFWQKVKDRHSDATAVEMEGHGFGVAVHRFPGVRGLLLRGISDLLDDKAQSDQAGGQELAARNAAAVAFAVLRRIQPLRLSAQKRVVEISACGTGFEWTGAVTVDQGAHLCSREDFVEVLRIGFAPRQCLSPLRNAILRLLLHVDVARVELTDKAMWQQHLTRLDGEVAPAFIDWRTCPWADIPAIDGAVAEMPQADLASRIEDALDGATLDMLDDRLKRYLSGEGGAGLPRLEEALADDLLDLWDEWRAAITVTERRRFLDMLLHFEDEEPVQGARIWVGPKSVETCMLPATVLALAVVSCGEGLWAAEGSGPMRPHACTPGNLGNGTVFGHCCGADMVKSTPVEHYLEDTPHLPWRSGLVVLGNVNTSFLLAQLRGRNLQAARPTGYIDEAPSPYQVAICRDRKLSAALKSGRPAVRSYLEAVVAQMRKDRQDFLDHATREM